MGQIFNFNKSQKEDFYEAKINVKGKEEIHIVRASSDFEAAQKIKMITGKMPTCADDIIGPLSIDDVKIAQTVFAII